jgi:protein TonB
MKIALIISILIHIGVIVFLNSQSWIPDQQKPQLLQLRVSLRNEEQKGVGDNKEVQILPRPLEESGSNQPSSLPRPLDFDFPSVPRPEVTHPFQDRQFVEDTFQPVKPESRGQKMVPALEEALLLPKPPELSRTLEKPDRSDQMIPEPSVKPEIWKPEEPIPPKPISTIKEVTPEAKKAVVKNLKPAQKVQKPRSITPKPTTPVRPLSKPIEQTLNQKVEQNIPSDKEVSKEVSTSIIQTPPEDSGSRILETTPGKREDYLPPEQVGVATSHADTDSPVPAGQSFAEIKPKEPSSPAGMEFDPLTDPVPRYNPHPEYPREARRFGWEGTVLLIIQVLPDGSTGKIEIKESSGYSVLDQAAVQAIRRWRFEPAQRQGISVPATIELPVIFKLN